MRRWVLALIFLHYALLAGRPSASRYTAAPLQWTGTATTPHSRQHYLQAFHYVTTIAHELSRNIFAIVRCAMRHVRGASAGTMTTAHTVAWPRAPPGRR
jgi:hypothetical protein